MVAMRKLRKIIELSEKRRNHITQAMYIRGFGKNKNVSTLVSPRDCLMVYMMYAITYKLYP
jgi:hypothetical protein